jgi:CRISPR-associated protein Csy3
MTTIALPSVLSFCRSLQPGLGYFYGVNQTGEETPVLVQRTTVRGVIGDYKSGTGENDKNVNAPNIQTIDTANLAAGFDTYKCTFSLRIIPGAIFPEICNEPGYEKHLLAFGTTFVEKGGTKRLAKLYFDNIANGRWLWRNRNADSLKITITLMSKNKKIGECAFYPLAHEKSQNTGTQEFEMLFVSEFQRIFETSVKTGGNKILNESLSLDVEAFGKIGDGLEVFPSQEFVEKETGKAEGKLSRVLARSGLKDVNDQAVLHPQKIGNAIRTIDTWYPGADGRQIPIPIEPFGVDASRQHAFRHNTKPKSDLYTLLEQIDVLTGDLAKVKIPDEVSNDAMFVFACLIRGGVFGGGKEAKNVEKEKATKAKGTK